MFISSSNENVLKVLESTEKNLWPINVVWCGVGGEATKAAWSGWFLHLVLKSDWKERGFSRRKKNKGVRKQSGLGTRNDLE